MQNAEVPRPHRDSGRTLLSAIELCNAELFLVLGVFRRDRRRIALMDASEPFSPHRPNSKHTLALRQAEDGNLNLNQSLTVPGEPRGQLADGTDLRSAALGWLVDRTGDL